MNQIKEHIIYKIVALTLGLTFMIPSFVKLAHAFENHEHEVYVGPQKLHFHKFELDCDCCKFKFIKNQYVLTSILIESSVCLINSEIFDKKYIFYYNLKLNNIQLRGPPSIIC